MKTLSLIRESSHSGRKLLAVLLDPDKVGREQDLLSFVKRCERSEVDVYLVGGSLLTTTQMPSLIRKLKTSTSRPVVIFPGSQLHISDEADAILLLSLISGRNPDLLIGKHVEAAPFLKASNIEILSTGYILIGDSNQTTVAYLSQTSPIPYEKSEIAACTAMAGAMLGLQLIYLDAGSGARREVQVDMVKEVKKSIEIPLIVGGGIDSTEKAIAAWKAGADMIVVGNASEKDPSFIEAVARARKNMSV